MSITNAVIGKYCSIDNKCCINGGIHTINYVSSSPAFLEAKSAIYIKFTNLENIFR